MAMAITEEPQHLSSINTSSKPSSPAHPSHRPSSPRNPRLIDNMFGVLNRFMSKLDAAPIEEQQSGLHGAFGFQVLKNANLEVPLEPWFDFIIGINGRTIDNPDPNLFATEVRNCAGQSISFGIFSAKGQRIREVYLSIPAEKPTLGVSLQWSPLAIAEDVWHILDVIPNSPADVAGLLPYGDYVIGSPEGLARGESGLSELVDDFLNRPLVLYVYNHEYNVTRPVTITPTRSWGGEGALGCVLGFGALHRLPASLDEPPPAPGETFFSSDAGGSASFDEKRPLSATPGAPSELFVPANMALPSKSPPPQGSGAPPKRKGRAHHGAAPAGGGGLDDYFKEGEAKSMEEDFAPKKGSGGVPPPPKSGGPPRGGPPKSGAAAGSGTATPVPGDGEAEDGEAAA